MPNAPAGWYEDPGAPGGARFWTGAAWLAPGVGPSVAAPGGLPPQPTSFEPQPTGFGTQAEFLPAPAVPASHDQVLPVASEHLQPRAAEYQAVPQDDAVPWDVVGVPRTLDVAEANPALQAPWQGSAPQPYGRPGERGAFAPSPYASPSPYGSSASGRKRRSGWVTVAAVVAVVVVGLGVRWGVGQVLGSDYSDDGRIEVAAPASWTTCSIQDPDITYALDPSWVDITSAGGSDISGKGVRVVTARNKFIDASGKRALLIMGATPFSPQGANATRQDFEAALDKALGSVSDIGGDGATHEKLKVLTSSTGVRWGIQSATFPIADSTMTDFIAVTVIDDYAVIIQLFVPAGGIVTEADILGVMNSVKATQLGT